MKHFLHQGISDDMIEPFDEKWLVKAKKKVKIPVDKK